ncbi:hypothetical protein LI094_13835, partial [[Clostridium] saccharogumia]
FPCFFNDREIAWKGDSEDGRTPESVLAAYENRIFEMGKILEENNCLFSEFGTRRRRSSEIHDRVIKTLAGIKTLIGTSNVYFAKKYNLK